MVLLTCFEKHSWLLEERTDCHLTSFLLALDQGACKGPHLQNISRSSWDMKATACSSPSLIPVCLTARSWKHCPGLWSVWERHTNLCKLSLLPLLPRLRSAKTRFMLKTLKLSGLAVEMAPTKTNLCHSYTTTAFAGCLQTCSVLHH